MSPDAKERFCKLALICDGNPLSCNRGQQNAIAVMAISQIEAVGLPLADVQAIASGPKTDPDFSRCRLDADAAGRKPRLRRSSAAIDRLDTRDQIRRVPPMMPAISNPIARCIKIGVAVADNGVAGLVGLLITDQVALYRFRAGQGRSSRRNGSAPCACGYDQRLVPCVPLAVSKPSPFSNEASSTAQFW